MNVLVTSVGAATSIGVLKALRLSQNREFFFVGTDSNQKEFSCGSAFVDFFYTTTNVKLSLESYENELLQIISQHKIQCVIPIHDLEIEAISKICEEYPNITFWAVNSSRIVELCNDKQEINKYVENLGVKIPKMFSRFEKIDSFPVILKPNRGVSSRDMFVANNFAEYQFYAQLVKNEDYITQQFVQGEEFTIDCYSSYRTAKFYGGVVRKRIETKAGISTKAEIVNFPLLLELSENILNKMNFRGASNLQFIVSDNVPYFIEINPRFSGAGILSYQANFNSPLFTILEANNETIPAFDELKIKHHLKMTRYWNEVFYE